MSSAFENLKQRQTAIAPESVQKTTAFDVLKQRQSNIAPESIQTEQPKKSLLRKVGDFFTGSTQKFGESIGQSQALNTKEADALRESNAGLTSKQTEVQNLIDQKKSTGEDTSRLESTLAKTKPIATQTSQEEVFPVLKKSAKQIVGEGIGTGLEALSGGVLSSGAETVAAKGVPVLKKLNQLGKVGAAYGAIGSGSNAMQQDKSLGGIVGDTITGAAVGYGVGAGTAGAGILGSKTLNAIKNKVAPTTEVLTSKLDSNIKNIYKNTTGDVGKINESAFKAKKGLELLQKESANIKIPDINAPLGSDATKKFDLSKSKPNELISAVIEMDKKISENARTAVNEATKKGKIIDIKEAQNTIMKAMDNGDIPEATGNRILKQINNTKGDPTKVHDWVQDVNKKYGKKYERGTIDDTALGNLADDIAQSFRTKLDDIVDRKGYAEAFSNNQELKRMFINIAKKANKSVNFGDIGTDAGVDAAISMLTGNPLYMARTIGTSLFKGFVSNIKNQSGLKLIKNSAKIAGKLPTIQKLPSSEVKPISKLPVKSIGGTNKIRFSNDFRSETLPTIKMGKKPLPKLKRNINPELPTIEGKTNVKALKTLSGVTGGGVALSNLIKKVPNEESYDSGYTKPSKAKIADTLGALMQLESSGGTNKANADKGEKKWLTGLTPIAIKELKRVGLIKDIDINNETDVLNASVKYFNLMQEKNPELTPAEVYVDKYWTKWDTQEQRKKKMDEFNKLINK